MTVMFKSAFTVNEEAREKGFAESSEALEFLENELKHKFFGGDSIGLVDITGSFIAFWVPVIQEAGGFEIFSNEKFPKLYKWSQQLVNHPIVQEALPPREHIFAFFKSRFENLAASK